jgi:hypothetical protein
VRSGPGEARTILLLHIISVRPSKQPLMVRTFLKVYMELGSYFLFLQEQIKDIIIMSEVSVVFVLAQMLLFAIGCCTLKKEFQASSMLMLRLQIGTGTSGCASTKRTPLAALCSSWRSTTHTDFTTVIVTSIKQQNKKLGLRRILS